MKNKITQLLMCTFVLAAGWMPVNADAVCIGNLDPSLPGYGPKYYSAAHEFQRARYVVRARVIKETWLGEDGKARLLDPPFRDGGPRPSGFDPYIGTYYVVQITQVFKGAPSTELRLFSENTSGRFSLTPGGEYLLFITEEKFDPPVDLAFTIDACGRSAYIKKARATLRAVERLSVAR